MCRCEPSRGLAPSDTPAARGDELLGWAIQEFEAAVAAGTPPEIETFAAAYPDIEDRLRRVLRLWVGLGDLDAVSVEPELQVPKRLGPYHIGVEIGRGGMAPVFRARDDRIDRDVALKVLVPDPLHGTQRRQRFLREAQALARSAHPNVVPIHDVGEDEAWSYIAMDLMAGSLAEPEPIQGVSPADWHRKVIDWIHDAALGLAHAHSKGVLHRDVKLSNLLIDADGVVRVGDFGLSSIAGAATLTRSGQVVGTPSYAAPEQLRGEEIDARADVYALGACARSLFQIGAQESRARPDAPGQDMSLPADLILILDKATATEPGDRYPSMAALAADLAACRDGRRISIPTPRSRWRRRLALGAVVSAAALILSATWLGRPAPEAMAYRIKADSVFQAPTQRAQNTDRMSFAVHGRTLHAECRGGVHASVVLLDGATEVARHRLASRPWFDARCHLFGIRDVDDDGLPELGVLQSGTRITLKWSPNAWGPGIQSGWRRKVAAGFGFSSGTLADWDGDGEVEFLIADSGLHDGTTRTATLHVFQPFTGVEVARRPLPSSQVDSTVQGAAPGAEPAAALYLDAEMPPSVPPADPQARLWRIPIGAARFQPMTDRGLPPGATWPVFQDVDGDGRYDVIIGGRGDIGSPGRPATIAAYAEDLLGPALWTYTPAAVNISYLILADQDGDAIPELCYAGYGEVTCIRTQAGLHHRERVVWAAALDPEERVAHQPVAVGDLTGDGITEIAAGTSKGRIVVASKATAPALLHSIEHPRYLGSPPAMRRADITARLAVQPLPNGGVSIVAASEDAFVFATRLKPGSKPEPEWYSHHPRTGASMVASPQPIVVRVGRNGDLRSGVVIADRAGNVSLVLRPPVTGATSESTPCWRFIAEGGVSSTLAVLEADGVPWVFFADAQGYVYGIPLRLPEE